MTRTLIDCTNFVNVILYWEHFFHFCIHLFLSELSPHEYPMLSVFFFLEWCVAILWIRIPEYMYRLSNRAFAHLKGMKITYQFWPRDFGLHRLGGKSESDHATYYLFSYYWWNISHISFTLWIWRLPNDEANKPINVLENVILYSILMSAKLWLLDHGPPHPRRGSRPRCMVRASTPILLCNYCLHDGVLSHWRMAFCPFHTWAKADVSLQAESLWLYKAAFFISSRLHPAQHANHLSRELCNESHNFRISISISLALGSMSVQKNLLAMQNTILKLQTSEQKK